MSVPPDGIVLLAPMQGWSAPVSETPDPVFADKMLGEGIAIDPTLGELHAPCDGEVLNVGGAGHAVTIRADGGAEILLHIGIETVAMGGEGFEPLVLAHQKVTAGELLVRFDLGALAPRVKSLVSPMVITNGEAFPVQGAVVGREVRLGEPIMWLRAAARSAAATEAQAGTAAIRILRVGLAHGVHARPAALLAREAGAFASPITLAHGGRRANARSAVAIMTLGIARGDEVELTADGVDAKAAVDALAAILGAVGDHAPAPAPTLQARPSAAQAEAGDALVGVAAAPGLAIGAAVRLVEAEVAVIETAGAPESERAALAGALAAVRENLRSQLGGGGGDIVEAHLTFLADPELHAAAELAIARGASAGVAWRETVGGYVDELRALGDPRMAERAADLADLERQVQLRLSGETPTLFALPPSAIVLADDILPSQLLALDASRLAGLAIGRGGPTSHVAILAAAMNVPAVVALGPRLLAVRDGTMVILDGEAGRLQVAPQTAEIETAQTRLAELRSRRARAGAAAQEQCRMVDGARIEVFANVGGAGEARAAVENGAEGCGLLRTEFLFLDRRQAPDEEEQLRAYQEIADVLAGRPLIIRTLDVGGDKAVAYLPAEREANPALGLRGIRMGLARPELLEVQLRAILRVRPAPAIMLPMIASLAELRAVRALAADLCSELGAERPSIGVMVETPAAAVTSDLLAGEADFLSIGTNDLAQYALAMDRTNPRLAAQVDGLHPAVLRLVRQAAGGGALHGRTVAVCGGLASDLAAAPILIGLGIGELSAAPAIIPQLKAAIRELTMVQCQELAERALSRISAAEVRALEMAVAKPAPPRKGAVR
ncbi:MAG: phosphoenolpyruvate--protein phosphotransferase [Caulobacteraceae bacterium]